MINLILIDFFLFHVSNCIEDLPSEIFSFGNMNIDNLFLTHYLFHCLQDPHKLSSLDFPTCGDLHALPPG